MIFRLTPTQRSEVEGLLDVCDEERDVWGDPWGRLDGDRLTVDDPTAASEDLQRRAVWNEEEGYVNDQARVGAATARSLRALADKITEDAQAETVVPPQDTCSDTGRTP